MITPDLLIEVVGSNPTEHACLNILSAIICVESLSPYIREIKFQMDGYKSARIQRRGFA
jgi:hypothetical protein